MCHTLIHATKTDTKSQNKNTYCENPTKCNKDNLTIHTGEKITKSINSENKKIQLVLECYNCHGFSGTADYVLDRLSNCDIMGLTETWLRPNEKHSIKSTLQNHPSFKSTHKAYTVFSKSGMEDIEPDYTGRPFGGVSIIIKQNNYFTCKEIENLSDRIVTVGLYDRDDNLIQVLCCTYMPFFNGKKDQINLYVETIDALQSVIDQFAAIAPIKVIGDLNAQLPTSQKLPKKWHKQKEFNIYSSILYDFLTFNDFVSADLLQKQSVQYTYFCHANKTYTWIDHILCERREIDNITSCSIISEEHGNNSDHLPIRLQFSIPISESGKLQANYQEYKVPPNWSNAKHVALYSSLVTSKLSEIPLICTNGLCADELKYELDQRLEQINSILITATKESGCIPSKVLRPKTYWCPELSYLRDKKRMWWTIWVSCERPRTGIIFNILKDLKKKFRKISRLNINNIAMKETNMINTQFRNKNLNYLWNKLKINKKKKVCSNLMAEEFGTHFKNLNSDNIPLNEEQLRIQRIVSERASNLLKINRPFKCQNCDYCECPGCAHITKANICCVCRARDNANDHVHTTSREVILNGIKYLKKGTSPGIDCISPEHLIFATSPILADLLANIYSIMIRSSIIPEIFQKNLIIPILKKSTLDPNIPANFRPITLSSIHTKLVEYTLMPEDKAHINQFGFRKSRETMFATSLLNDVAAYTVTNNSALNVCSLDTEKCFDSIWHCGLFYKLMSIIPETQWLFLYSWYAKSFAQVRWQSKHSKEFHITKGMKQGSLISPRLFNIFIDDLLQNLQSMNVGVRIHTFHINSFAYADDLSLLSTTAAGLQLLINKCTQYAHTWRMRFNPLKTNIVCIGKQPHTISPTWKIDNAEVGLSEDTEVLGVTFNSTLDSNKHVKNRVRKCQQGTFSMTAMGLSYPGLNSDVKAFIWKTISSPLLAYGMESLEIQS